MCKGAIVSHLAGGEGEENFKNNFNVAGVGGTFLYFLRQNNFGGIFFGVRLLKFE